jgi:hypothetical protein
MYARREQGGWGTVEILPHSGTRGLAFHETEEGLSLIWMIMDTEEADSFEEVRAFIHRRIVSAYDDE